MKNDDIVHAYPPDRDARDWAIRLATQELLVATQRVHALFQEREALNSVTEIVDGVALHREDGWIKPVGEDICRCARICPNSEDDGRTSIAYTYAGRYGGSGERCHGRDLSPAEAERIALTWVVKGVR